MSIPQYLMGQVGQIDFSPAENALTRMLKQQQMNREFQLQQQRMGMDQQRLGFEEQRLGFDRQRAEQEMRLAPLRLDVERTRLDQARDELGFKRQHFPLQIASERERLAAFRDETAFKRETRPLELQTREAQLKALLEKGPMIKEVNGKLVRVLPDGTTQLLYDSGTNFDKLPEFAAKSAAFTTRMIDAERNVRDVMGKKDKRDALLFDPTSITTAAVRLLPEGVGNYALRGPEHQRYMQAAEQWIRAFLRKESGAAIGKDEFVRDFKVYFPQPGDGPDVVAQKAQARLRAMQGFAGETRNFHQHVDPRGHETLNEWMNPRTTKPPPIPKPGSEPVTVTTPDDARKLGKGQRFIYNGQEYEVQ